MSLEQILKVAVERIRSESLENEAQVKQAIILPILRALDWDDTNPAEFKPEFTVGKGWVDYALLSKGGGPRVFIEAKKLGNMDIAGEKQLFQYAMNNGVPFLILTDGNLWDFYLSMAAGPPPERRFFGAELKREEKLPEYARFLETHLRKSRVVSGSARRGAEHLHETNREREKARQTIPRAWRTLLETPDEMLRDLLAEEVERSCGTKPEPEDVVSFLQERLSPALSETTKVAPPVPRPRSKSSSSRSKSFSSSTPAASNRRTPTRIIGFILNNNHNNQVETGASYRTLAEVLKAFDKRDPEFMERLASQTSGRTRRLVARKRNDLYTDRPDFAEKASMNLGNGWWLGHNLSTRTIRKRIIIACEIAGVKFGSQLKLIES